MPARAGKRVPIQPFPGTFASTCRENGVGLRRLAHGLTNAVIYAYETGLVSGGENLSSLGRGESPVGVAEPHDKPLPAQAGVRGGKLPDDQVGFDLHHGRPRR